MNTERLRLLINHKYPFLRRILYPAIVVKRILLHRKSFYQEEIYNNLCKMLTEDPVIRVNEFQGIFALDCRSDLFKRLLITKQYEPELVSYCLRYLDRKRDVIDIGANVGFYTVLFAKNLDGRKVLAIEPTMNALRFLYRNIQLNQVENKVIVFEGAASNHAGITKIKTVEGREEYSSLGKWTHPSVSMDEYILQEVEVETVDRMVKMLSLTPGFMKVDVEGMEHLVFYGAKTVLEKNRPVILSELSNPLLKANGSSSLEVISFIKSLEYNVIDVITPNVPPERHDFTTIQCIPKEMGE